MSAWRFLVLEIARHGPMRGISAQTNEINNARRLGLIAHDAEHRWALTPLGEEFVDGRVVQVEVRPGGRRFVATWLRSLSQGLHFNRP